MSRPESHRRQEPRAATLRQLPPWVWRLGELTTHGRTSGRQAVDPPRQLTHSDQEIPQPRHTQRKGAQASSASESTGQCLVSSHEEDLRCDSRHLPGRNTVKRQTSPGSGEAFGRTTTGEPPSTSSSTVSDQHSADQQSMASTQCGRRREGQHPFSSISHRRRLQCSASGVATAASDFPSRSCNPATTLSFHLSAGSGGLGHCEVSGERR